LFPSIMALPHDELLMVMQNRHRVILQACLLSLLLDIPKQCLLAAPSLQKVSNRKPWIACSVWRPTQVGVQPSISQAMASRVIARGIPRMVQESGAKQLAARLAEDVWAKPGVSQVSGIGVFSIRDIPKNTIIDRRWSNAFGTDTALATEAESLSEEAKYIRKIWIGAMPATGPNTFLLSSFVNHADHANAHFVLDASCDGWLLEASRDIDAGEEIFVNYIAEFKYGSCSEVPHSRLFEVMEWLSQEEIEKRLAETTPGPSRTPTRAEIKERSTSPNVFISAKDVWLGVALLATLLGLCLGPPTTAIRS